MCLPIMAQTLSRRHDNKNQSPASSSLFNDVTLKFHVSISYEPEEMCSINNKKSLHILERHIFKIHIPLFLIILLVINNSASIAAQIDSIKCHSNYLRPNIRY